MDEVLIENWNKVVKPGDKVYHLGDVWMGSAEKAEKTLSRLNGQKRLILGNHDGGKDRLLHKFFRKIDLWRTWRDHGLIFTHLPMHESGLQFGESGQGKEVWPALNIHGHIHANPSPKGPYRCVCVEQTNYTPINIEELRKH